MKFCSTGEVAKKFHTEVWRVRQLFEIKEVPAVQQVAGKKIIPAAMLPKIESELKRRGWLNTTLAKAERIKKGRKTMSGGLRKV